MAKGCNQEIVGVNITYVESIPRKFNFYVVATFQV